MQTILKEIYDYKVEFVSYLKQKKSQKEIEKKISDQEQPRGFISAISTIIKKNKPAIIAEVKKASPSKGIIKKDFNPVFLAKQYEKGNATCISVLTDEKYFLGSNSDLIEVKNNVKTPILRKEFIISEYQIFESRAIGADCILLISEILSESVLKNFISIAKMLDLNVIIEVHSEKDLKKFLNIEGVLIGINNRNLKNMKVDINHAIKLTKKLNKNRIICESGINSLLQFKGLIKENFKIFLIGEYFMKQQIPSKELIKFSSCKI